MCVHKVVTRKEESKLPMVSVGQGLFDLEDLMQGVAVDMTAFATTAGFQMMKGFIDQEVNVRAGDLHSQTTEINRWGRQKGSVIVGGQRLRLQVPRLRTREGKEVPLSSYQAFLHNDGRSKAVYDRLLAGVSCRDYAGTVETMVDGYGISRSVANREMIKATAKDLKTVLERDLAELDLYILLVDGVRLGGRMMIVAEGVDSCGKKHILGFREGSTETARVCLDLLHDLIRRQLKMDRPMLVVIDGSRALRSAVDKFFGSNAFVQRCQQHKREDLKKYLPDELHAEIDRKLTAAYAMTSYDDAEHALRTLVNELSRLNLSAAHSLQEGLEETLTLHLLELPDVLRKTLSTTNLIESAFSTSRRVMRNVKRWSNSTQAQRWTATALLRSEKRFRRIKGFRVMPSLINGLDEQAKKRGLFRNTDVA